MKSIIEIKQELRPCLVNGKKALFHLWIKGQSMLGESLIAVIEYENGEIDNVVISYDIISTCKNTIKFLDNKFKEYNFGDNNE